MRRSRDWTGKLSASIAGKTAGSSHGPQLRAVSCSGEQDTKDWGILAGLSMRSVVKLPGLLRDRRRDGTGLYHLSIIPLKSCQSCEIRQSGHPANNPRTEKVCH